MANSDRGHLFHPCARHLRLLGIRHSLASLLPGLDVCRRHRVVSSRESLGPPHRNLRRGPVGLCEYFCDQLFLQRPATAFAVDAYRILAKARLAHRCTRMVFESPGRSRVYLGVFASVEKVSQRCRQIRGGLRAHNRILRIGYGTIPIQVPRRLSPIAPPTPAVLSSQIPSAFAREGGKLGECYRRAIGSPKRRPDDASPRMMSEEVASLATSSMWVPHFSRAFCARSGDFGGREKSETLRSLFDQMQPGAMFFSHLFDRNHFAPES